MSGCPNKQPERHSEYYISSGDLHLLVDNVLFRVHSYFFERDSEKFRKILGCPVAPNQARAGSSDSKPYPIKNSSPSEVAKFLWVFYNTTYSDYSTATVHDWTSILKIACEYDFCEVQHCAIRGLQTCDLTTVERIKIYEMYKADPKFLVPLYIEMAMRADAPTDDEVRDLGSATALLIFRLREYLRSRAGFGGKSPLPPDVTKEDALHAVCVFLGLDPARIQLPGDRTTRARRSLRRVPTPRGGSLDRDRDRDTLEERRRAVDFERFLEGCVPIPVTPATQEDVIIERAIPGGFEVLQEDAVSGVKNHVHDDHERLALVLYRADRKVVGYAADNRVGDVSLSGRDTLLVCAISWACLSLWTLNHIPNIYFL